MNFVEDISTIECILPLPCLSAFALIGFRCACAVRAVDLGLLFLSCNLHIHTTFRGEPFPFSPPLEDVALVLRKHGTHGSRESCHGRWFHPVVSVRAPQCWNHLRCGKHPCVCSRWTTRPGEMSPVPTSLQQMGPDVPPKLDSARCRLCAQDLLQRGATLLAVGIPCMWLST